MITFEKVNDLQAFVKRGSIRIGILEKTIGGYLLTINNDNTVFIPTKNKKIIPKLSMDIYKIHERFFIPLDDIETHCYHLMKDYPSIPIEQRIILE